MSPLRAARCVSVTSNKATHAVGSRASTCSTRIVSTTGSSATVPGLSSSPPPLFLQTQTLNPNPEIGLGLASKHPKPLPLLRTRAQPVVANLASITCETVTPDSGCAHGYSPLTRSFVVVGGGSPVCKTDIMTGASETRRELGEEQCSAAAMPGEPDWQPPGFGEELGPAAGMPGGFGLGPARQVLTSLASAGEGVCGRASMRRRLARGRVVGSCMLRCRVVVASCMVRCWLCSRRRSWSVCHACPAHAFRARCVCGLYVECIRADDQLEYRVSLNIECIRADAVYREHSS